MNYSLSSARKIDDYWQKIITTWFGANKTANTGALTWLEAWHTKLKFLDNSGITSENIKYLGFTENEGSGSDNEGQTGDGEFVVLSKSEGSAPKTVTFRIKGFNLNNINDLINSNCQRLIGSTANAANNYLISAMINLH